LRCFLFQATIAYRMTQSRQPLRMNSDSATDTIAAALKAGRLTQGHLWSPREAGRATGSLEERSWFVSARVSPLLLSLLLLSEEDFQTRSDVFRVASGGVFWVIARQIDALQHRILVPLAGDSVRALVESLAESDLRFFYSDGEHERGVASTMRVAPALQTILGASLAVLDDAPALIQDLFLATTQLLEPRGFPAVSGMPALSEVFLTGVATPEMAPWNSAPSLIPSTR
jgi:hypothetical protein